MGRGRAKAKQTRVARELKYRSVSTDFSSLERELRGPASDIPDAYSDLAEQYGVDDDDEYDEDDDDEDDDDDDASASYSMRRSG
jgi:hypothetical protein